MSGGGSDSSVGPQLKSADELLKAMDKTPLFMNSLQPENGENNDMLEALQALVFDGTPQGNSV